MIEWKWLKKTKSAILFYKNMDQDNESQKMVFEGKEFQQSARSFETQTTPLTRWAIKYSDGLIKNEKQAGYVFLGVIILSITVSLTLLFSGKKVSPPINSVTTEDVLPR